MEPHWFKYNPDRKTNQGLGRKNCNINKDAQNRQQRHVIGLVKCWKGLRETADYTRFGIKLDTQSIYVPINVHQHSVQGNYNQGYIIWIYIFDYEPQLLQKKTFEKIMYDLHKMRCLTTQKRNKKMFD